MRLARVLLAVGLAGASLAQDAPVRGDYLEDRSNHVFGCYCEWSGESQTGGREAIIGWRIASGTVHGVDLTGVLAAAVVRGDATLSLGAPPRRSVLLLSRLATPVQRREAEALLRDHFGALLGTILAVRAVEIDFERNAQGGHLRVPGVLTLEMRRARLPDDALPGAKPWFGPFLPLEEAELGTTEHVSYKGPEFAYRWSRSEPLTTGYFGAFVLYPR